jgi:hypothetical protein
MQSRKMSWVETCVSTAAGFGTALLLQVTVLPLYGLEADMRGNLEIGAVFTAASLIRGFLVRRLFAKLGRC